ncbi:hypothetical protein EDB85DRAFT_812449 [Lactarius pseudohatsudake]|nr:hypothetical protein EDB85DRAFT_812449 [Lactarius pseudohatsudake]
MRSLSTLSARRSIKLARIRGREPDQLGGSHGNWLRYGALEHGVRSGARGGGRGCSSGSRLVRFALVKPPPTTSITPPRGAHPHSHLQNFQIQIVFSQLPRGRIVCCMYFRVFKVTPCKLMLVCVIHHYETLMTSQVVYLKLKKRITLPFQWETSNTPPIPHTNQEKPRTRAPDSTSLIPRPYIPCVLYHSDRRDGQTSLRVGHRIP